MACICDTMPYGIRVYMRLESSKREDPHFHAYKGKGYGRKELQVFFYEDTVVFVNPPKPRDRISEKERKMVVEWAAAHVPELQDRFRTIESGGRPAKIPFP